MTAVFISLMVISFQFTLGTASGIWIVIMMCIYMAALAFSINSVIWVLTKIFPNSIRGRAMSIATFANWSINFITAFIFPWYVAKIGMGAGFFTLPECVLSQQFSFISMFRKQKERVWKKLKIIGVVLTQKRNMR